MPPRSPLLCALALASAPRWARANPPEGAAASNGPAASGETLVQQRTSTVPARPAASWNAFPLLAYSPETQLAFGGFGVYYFRIGELPGARPSYLAAAAMYTTENQVLADVFPEFWFDHDNWVVTGQFGYRRFPDSYFGLGNATRDEDEERYLFHTFFDRMDLRRRVWRGIFAGLRQEFQVHAFLDPEPGGALERGGLTGLTRGTRSGGGPLLVWDTRDNTLAAHGGAYYLATLTTFQPWTGSDYAYTRFNFDARHYLPLGERHTIAVQYYVDINSGDVPIHALAQLGGPYRMRGYFEGRFRDKIYLMTQVEWRIMPVVWRFGLAFFAGAGEVAPSFGDLDFGGIHWAVGGGLRFALNPAEHIHLRADAGVGPGTWGAYVNVLEAF